MRHSRRPNFNFFLTLFAIYYLIFNIAMAGAQTMSNDNYMLQLRDLDTIPGKQEADQSVKGIKIQEALKQEQKPQVKIQDSSLTFSISETLIYFGPLFPTNPILRSNKLGIANDSQNGYSVIAFEDKELSWPTSLVDAEFPEIASQSGMIIPDASCDDGQCLETNSALWINPLTYGFGYRCDNIIGSGCLSDSSDPNSYRQFANISKNEMPQTIISGSYDKKESIYEITYKVNIAGTQLRGSYSNTISFIAVPNY